MDQREKRRVSEQFRKWMKIHFYLNTNVSIYARFLFFFPMN